MPLARIHERADERQRDRNDHFVMLAVVDPVDRAGLVHHAVDERVVTQFARGRDTENLSPATLAARWRQRVRWLRRRWRRSPRMRAGPGVAAGALAARVRCCGSRRRGLRCRLQRVARVRAAGSPRACAPALGPAWAARRRRGLARSASGVSNATCTGTRSRAADSASPIVLDPLRRDPVQDGDDAAPRAPPARQPSRGPWRGDRSERRAAVAVAIGD